MDDLLLNRRYDPPRDGFEERIIASARRVEQEKKATVLGWFTTFTGELLPHPAIAYAATLIIGLAIGFGAQWPAHQQTTLQTYLDDDGGML